MIYHGRIAPSPSGLLHVGNIQTFWIAKRRADLHNGMLSLRIEDIDQTRCKKDFLDRMLVDMSWFGLIWEPNVIIQSQRKDIYIDVWRKLLSKGYIYPSPHSRRDVLSALSAPHEGENEIIFPVILRPEFLTYNQDAECAGGMNYRFLVPDGRIITFHDNNMGPQSFQAGVDFGDFIVWSGVNDLPSYELAVVVDDADMKVTEVVRGEDLLLSTARQILIYEALDFKIPEFYHCPLFRDSSGKRMAKRSNATSLESMRLNGLTPERIRDELFQIPHI